MVVVIRESSDSIVDILSRPQVWQLRHHSLIPGRGRDFSLLQSAHDSSGSHPASCSVGMEVAWHAADHSYPFTVVLRLCVCVELNLHSPECLHSLHRNNFTYTRLHWKHWIRFLSEEWLLQTYCRVQLASAFLGHKWQCLFFPELVAEFCRFVWTPVAFSATQFEAVWVMYGRSIWSPSFSNKRVDNATFFSPSYPRFYRSQSPSLLWLLGILSQRRENVCAVFVCSFFWEFTSLPLVYLVW